MSRPNRTIRSSLTVAVGAAVGASLLGVSAPCALAMPAPDPESGQVAGDLAEAPGPEARLLPRSGEPAAAGRPRGEWPLQPRPPVTSYFEAPELRWGSGHRGVDLQGRTGQPVRAALAGRVSFAGRIAGMPVVVVDHGATRTTYQPVRATVARGTQVAAGAVIGTLEWTGTHCSPAACLHWGWIRGESYLDPLLLVGAAPRPVRLLPL